MESDKKTALYYFSGTGNSLWVARELSKNIGGCELYPIAGLMKNNCESIKPEVERVGIVCPVYAGGLPEIVAKFIEKIDFSGAEYIFLVSTFAGAGESIFRQFRNLLKKKSRKPDGGFYVVMPGNHVGLFNVLPKNKETQIIEAAELKIKKIASAINLEKKETQNGHQIINFFNHMFYNGMIKNLHNLDSAFFADEKCNGCKTCEAVCPVGNIKVENGNPVWLHKCQYCYGCINFCPRAAIQTGKKTQKKGRYHHPEVSVHDMINQKGMTVTENGSKRFE
ncbi:MAG: EFR1 family ferrodoxin [Methanomicrobium sp.]|nr:EFR1 family ferrodoxin [Methanomicrobium sp.]